MLIDTRIKSFLIPNSVWKQGIPKDIIETKAPEWAMLPSLEFPSRDAIAIEIRASHGVNLLNEQRRYAICCERIQDITLELSRISGLLRPPLIWPKEVDTNKIPRTRALLAINTWIVPWMTKFIVPNFPNAYARIPAIFFPPEHAKSHCEIYQLMSRSPEIQKLFQKAARESTVPEGQDKITFDECQKAFLLRLELLKVAANQAEGLVDVFEIV
jgi:hypothetical protein